MNHARLLALLVFALVPLAVAGCGNKGPLVQARPVPPTIDGTPTIESGDETPTEGTKPAEEAVEDALEDADPSDEIVLPDETAPAELSPESEPEPEPAPEAVPPAGDPYG